MSAPEEVYGNTLSRVCVFRVKVCFDFEGDVPQRRIPCFINYKIFLSGIEFFSPDFSQRASSVEILIKFLFFQQETQNHLRDSIAN